MSDPVRGARHGGESRCSALRYEDRSFDLVAAILVWHHLGAWQQATAEVHRVMRPGGQFLMADLLNPFFVAPNGKLFAPAGSYTLAELRGAVARTLASAPGGSGWASGCGIGCSPKHDHRWNRFEFSDSHAAMPVG